MREYRPRKGSRYCINTFLISFARWRLSVYFASGKFIVYESLLLVDFRGCFCFLHQPKINDRNKYETDADKQPGLDNPDKCI